MGFIEDGLGRGAKAEVSIDNKLSVRAITEYQGDHQTELEDRYNLNTGNITLTSGGESAVLYLKYTADRFLHITALIYNFSASTGGSGYWLASVYRNPSAGTIVSDAVDVEMISNMNFKSNNLIGAHVYKGGEAKTLTGGQKSIESIISSNGARIVVALGALILNKGDTIGVTFTPPAGNTNAVVNCAISCFEKDKIL